MSDKNKIRRYETETLGVPPLKIVLGEIPNPEPQNRRKFQSPRKSDEMEMTVLKLIAHLKQQSR